MMRRAFWKILAWGVEGREGCLLLDYEASVSGSVSERAVRSLNG